VVPIQALVTREKPAAKDAPAVNPGDKIEEGVYLLEGGAVRFVPVKTGLTGSLEIEVKEGLTAGQEIVIGPFRALRELKDGDKVVVQEEAQESEK